MFFKNLKRRWWKIRSQSGLFARTKKFIAKLDFRVVVCAQCSTCTLRSCNINTSPFFFFGFEAFILYKNTMKFLKGVDIKHEISRFFF